MSSESAQEKDWLGTELQQLLHGIRKIIANLFRISTMIRKANVSHDRFLKSSKIDVSYYEPFDIQHARNRFPSASERLTDRMGKAISRRRQYLKYREQHHEKLALPNPNLAHSDLPAKGSETMTKLHSVPPSKAPTGQQSAAYGTGTEKQVSTIQSTNASTFIPSKIPEPVNLDADIYSTADTLTSHATSVAGEERLRVPLPPETSRDSQDFECPYCYTICRLNGKEEWQRRREWKRHVYKDLQPYMCTFDSCFKSEVMFEKRREWYNHELQVHRREWCCNARDHEAYQDKAHFIEHMKNLHADSYDPAALPSVVSLFERPATTTTGSCPFCTSEDTQYLSVSRLEKHLARHMEVLALFALPRTNDAHNRGSMESGLPDASQESESNSGNHDGQQGPPQLPSAKSGSHGDPDVPELQPRSAFENVLHTFCAVEAAQDLSVPKYLLQGKNKNEDIQFHESSTEIKLALSRKIDLLPDGDIKLAELLSRLHSECHAEFRITCTFESLHQTVNHFIYGIVGSVETSIERHLNDIDSSADRLQETKHQISQLRRDMGESLGEGQDISQGYPLRNDSWDYIKPKVLIAPSTLTLLSRASATLRRLAEPATTQRRGGYREIEHLWTNLETLIRTMNGVEFDNKLAHEVEQMVWSGEGLIVVLNSWTDLKGEENKWVTLTSLTRLANTIRKLLEGHEVDPLHPEETTEDYTLESDKESFHTIVSWLKDQSPDQTILHQAALAAWQLGTSEWFLNSDQFAHWVERIKPRLWVLGNPGCGKTVLCAAIVERLKRRKGDSRSSGLVYYYGRLGASMPSAANVLQSFLAQCCLQLRRIPDGVRGLFNRYSSLDRLPLYEDLLEVFGSVVRLFDSFHIVIDDIDQYLNGSHLLEALSFMEPLVCTLVTSRDLTRVRQTSCFLIEESHVAVDTAIMLRVRLQARIPQGNSMNDIVRSIVDQTHGMFLWADLQARRILLCANGTEIEEVISSPPTQIYDSWRADLNRLIEHQDDGAVSAIRLFEILSVAGRSMSYPEIGCIDLSYPDSKPLFTQASPLVETASRYSTFLAYIPSTQGLNLPVNYNIQLVHPGLRKLLFSDLRLSSVSETEANLNMAESCLRYLLQFVEHISRIDEDILDRCSLLLYAAQYWYTHALHGDRPSLQTLLFHFFTTTACFVTWLSVHNPDHPESKELKGTYPSPLYYACLLGFRGLAESLINHGARFDTAGGKHNYPLLAAVQSGYKDIVDLLLERADDANRRFKNIDTAIIRAAAQDKRDIVQSLLDHGADPDAKDKRHLTALHWAVRQPSRDIVQQLIDAGADVNARDNHGRTALHYTLNFEKPDTDMFNLLIEAGVDVLSPDEIGKTILHYATEDRYLEGMECLIAIGAQVDKQDHRGRTALQEATSWRWLEGVLYLLSSCYADPDLQDEFGQTALHCAVFHAAGKNDRLSADIIEYLLSASADQDIKNKAVRTPLEMARLSPKSLDEVMKVLESAHTQRNLTPAVLYLKQKHINKSLPMAMPAIVSEKCPFRVGMLRRQAAKVSGIKDARELRLFLNDGLSASPRELSDDTEACDAIGLRPGSEVICVLRDMEDTGADDFDIASRFSDRA